MGSSLESTDFFNIQQDYQKKCRERLNYLLEKRLKEIYNVGSLDQIEYLVRTSELQVVQRPLRGGLWEDTYVAGETVVLTHLVYSFHQEFKVPRT